MKPLSAAGFSSTSDHLMPFSKQAGSRKGAFWESSAAAVHLRET
jgi:hypothetical protein